MNITPTSRVRPRRRIGFISTRFEGNDGVSLETTKWVQVLERLNCDSFFFAGASEWESERSLVVPEAHFKHPEIQQINQAAFSSKVRTAETTRHIQRIKDYLKIKLAEFVRQFGIELLLVENALAIPMNIPLGLALTEFIAETGFPTIAHHHDFAWERKRFLVSCVDDYLNTAFPPELSSIRHVVINSLAAQQFSLRTGLSGFMIPNVMDFETPPKKNGSMPTDPYCIDLRTRLNIQPEDWFLLQPTRVVPRKGIEHAIELARRLGSRSRLVISHASGDEGHEYEIYLRQYAQLLNVSVNFVSDIIQKERGQKDSCKVFALADVYANADLITYPSDLEGFGNAFLEAIYYQKPILINNYSIFTVDIKPKGFQVIDFDGFINDRVIANTQKVLQDPAIVQEMVEHNYQLGKRYYSFSTLERLLQTLLSTCFGEEPSSHV